MADSKKKTPQNDAPEIEMVKFLGRVPSKQFVIPTSANHNSLDEYLTNNFNTSNKNAKTNDSIKSSIFSDNLNNTTSSQTQSKEDDLDSYNRNDVKDDGNANNDRVDLRRISSHKIVSKTKYLISIRTDTNIFRSELMVSSRHSCMKCRQDSIENSRKWSRCGSWALVGPESEA